MLTNIELPDGINIIKRGAFQETGLTNIEFPSSLETIEPLAFHCCYGLGRVYIPRTVKKVDNQSFYNSSAVVMLYADSDAAEGFSYWEGEPVPFGFVSPNAPDFELHKVKRNDGSSYLSIDYIGDQKEVTFPAVVGGINVLAIEVAAGSKSRTIEEVIIPEGIVEIKYNAFYLDYALKSLTLPRSLVIFNSDGIASNVEIRCFRGSAADGWARFSNYPVAYLNDDTSIPQADNVISLPSAIKTIESMAFMDVTSKYYRIPESISFIADDAFPNDSTLLVKWGSFADQWAKDHSYAIYYD